MLLILSFFKPFALLENLQIGAINIQPATNGIRAVSLPTQDMTTDTKPRDVFEKIKDILRGMINKNIHFEE